MICASACANNQVAGGIHIPYNMGS
jgi:hypothetical protein